MKISKQSQTICNLGVNKDVAKLVGEFASFDTDSETDFFYEFYRTGSTYITVDDFEFCPAHLGCNMICDKFVIKSRTAKSYVVDYQDTEVFVKSFPNVLFKFKFVDPVKIKIKQRRVFPFRRAHHTEMLMCLDFVKKQKKEFLQINSDEITSLGNNNFIVTTNPDPR